MWAAGTECAPVSCSSAVKTLPSECDGAGSCAPGATVNCMPPACTGAVCAGDCPNDAACPMSQYCDLATGNCTDKLPDGAPCQESTANRCQSGICNRWSVLRLGV